jgi:hypothetical protein
MNGTGKSLKQWSYSMKFRNYGRITAIVILWSFLTIRVFGEQPMTRETDSIDGSMRYYSDIEVARRSEELSGAAEEAIEKAAAEGARAGILALVEREAAAMREAHRWEGEYRNARSAGIKGAVITGVICFFGGLALGAGTVAIMGGR